MGTTGECAGIRPQLGVDVTGAIAPADRAALVRHLASCQRCRDELAGLAALPALLRRLPAPAPAQPPGQSAAAHEPDAGEALLGRVLSRMAVRRRRRRRALAAAAAVLAAAAATGWALRLGSPPPGPAGSGTVLRAETIGGVTVLADAAGFTLYWFAPDTAARSNCTGSCARRWPPVTGPATAAAGVTGAVSRVTRTDGSIQATYDGHPLYTGSVDAAPGQARGNGMNASGGLWHEVTVGGAAAPASSPSPGMRSGGSGGGGYGY
jgi:predicted lipoprotein with Yx(FWY)xxD motif